MIRAVVFLLGVCFLLHGISNVTMRKTSGAKLRAFYENKDTFDVLFTGISHMEVAYSPLELYQDYGITSFNFGESGNQLPTSYWVIRNALDYADPKVVVVDVRKIEDDAIVFDNLSTTSFDAVPFSRTKLETANDLFHSLTDKVEFLLPLLRYHSRWKELTENDFTDRDVRLDMGTLHYQNNRLEVAVPRTWRLVTTDKREVTGSVSEQYLRKLVELCRERGVEVLLLNLPYPADKQSQFYANGVITIAEELGVPYLDLVQDTNTFNYDTDMNDSYGHLNDSGAWKVTRVLGEYLREHYDLEDRRLDETCRAWEEALASYKKYKAGRISAQKKADTTLMLMSDDEFGKCLYLRAGSELLTDSRFSQLIQNMAGNVPLEELFEAALAGESYFLLVDCEGGGVYESRNHEALETDTTAFGHVIFSVDSEGNPVLYLDGSENRLSAVAADDEDGPQMAAIYGASWMEASDTALYVEDAVKAAVISASKKK